jgi:hypothetical protein
LLLRAAEQVARGLESLCDRDSRGICCLCSAPREGAKGCNGFRQKDGTICAGRQRLCAIPSKYLLCFACGGNHTRGSCQIVPVGRGHEVVEGIFRCTTCFLSQVPLTGVHFHPPRAEWTQDSAKRGPEENRSCRSRGDQNKAMLTAFYHSKYLAHRFMKSASGVCVSCPPHTAHTLAGSADSSPPQKRTATSGFSQFWDWLWLPSPAGHSIRHIDVVLAFAFAEVAS